MTGIKKLDWKLSIISVLLISLIGLGYYNTVNITILETAGSMYKLRIIIYSIILITFWGFYAKKGFKVLSTTKNITYTLSIIFSIFLTIGTSIYLFHDVSLCIGSIKRICIWMGQLIIQTILLLPIISLCINWIQTYKLSRNAGKISYTNLYLLCVIVRVVYWIVFYPALFDFDAGFGLRTMLKPDEVISNHHPFVIQWIHSFFYKIGESIGNPEFGIGCLTITFIILTSLIILYVLKSISKLNINSVYLRIIGYLFALFPYFDLISVYPTKDGIFAYGFLLYQVIIFNLVISHGKCLRNWKFQILSFLTIIVLCLSRHQGIYIVIIETFLLLFWLRNSILSFLTSVLPGIIVIFAFNYLYIPYSQIEPTNKKESYNMLFQQSARTLKYHNSAISEKQKYIIGKVLPIDSIVLAYRYNITDNVKSYYNWRNGEENNSDGLLHFKKVNHTGEKEALYEYQKVWLTMAFQHPISYINATLGVIGGYFYNMGISLIVLDSQWQLSKATTPEYSFSQNVKIISETSKLLGIAANTPILDIIAGIPSYIWLTITLISILLWRRDYKGLCLFAPIILSLFILSICPVTVGRYVWPIVVSLPLLAIYVINSNPVNNKTL